MGAGRGQEWAPGCAQSEDLIGGGLGVREKQVSKTISKFLAFKNHLELK